jgi:hypothetical protein
LTSLAAGFFLADQLQPVTASFSSPLQTGADGSNVNLKSNHAAIEIERGGSVP